MEKYDLQKEILRILSINIQSLEEELNFKIKLLEDQRKYKNQLEVKFQENYISNMDPKEFKEFFNNLEE
jgi:predicted nucleotide-binding protein (sugar kinase/HSP70/actin superfamily)